MHQLSLPEINGLIGLVQITKGLYPIGAGYHSLVRVQQIYDGGKGLVTPDSDNDELVVGVDVVINWLDKEAEEYGIATDFHQRLLAKKVDAKELSQVSSLVQLASKKKMSFFLNTEGLIYYGLPFGGESMPHIYAVNMFKVPKDEMQQAEAALRNIAVVTYLPQPGWIATLSARNGTCIDDLLNVTSIGPLQLH